MCSIDVTYASYNFGQVGFLTYFCIDILLEFTVVILYNIRSIQYFSFSLSLIEEYVELNLIVGLHFFLFWCSQSLYFVHNIIGQPFVIP